MPVMDGTKFLEYKHMHSDLANVPVIILTADAEPEMQKKTVALGAADYIKKPFVREVIEKRVENVVSAYLHL